MEGSGSSSFKKKWIYASFVYVYNVLATSKMIEKALMLTLGLKYSLMMKKIMVWDIWSLYYIYSSSSEKVQKSDYRRSQPYAFVSMAIRITQIFALKVRDSCF